MVSTGIASRSAFQPPELFTFSKPEGWPKWIRRFERFRDASGLDGKEEAKQISTLIYPMGDEAEDTLQSFQYTAEEQETYTAVRNKFAITILFDEYPELDRMEEMVIISPIQEPTDCCAEMVLSCYGWSLHAISGLPGPSMAATDSHTGPSMAPQNAPLGSSVAPQVVPSPLP